MALPPQILITPQATASQIGGLGPVPSGSMVFDTTSNQLLFTSNNGATYESIGTAGIVTQQIYVSQISGSDITGTGASGAPYATISFAISQISGLATSSTPYLIYSSGNFSDTNWSLFPWISYDFNGGSYAVTNSVGLDPSFSSGGNATISNVTLSLPAGMFLDFDSISQTGSVIIKMQNIFVLSVNNYTIHGSTSGSTIFICENMIGTVTPIQGLLPVLTIHNCDCYVASCLLWDTTFLQSDPSNPHVYNIDNNQFYGGGVGFLATVSAGQGYVFDVNNFYIGNGPTFSTQGASSFLETLSYGSSCLNGLNLSATDPGTNFFSVDKYLNAVPIITGPVTILNSEISNGMASNVVFSNSTAIDSSVAGGLKGLDNQLGLNSASGQFTATIANVLSTNGVYSSLYGVYSYGKSAAGNVCTINVKYQYTPTAVDNFISILVPIATGNFTTTSQANLMGSNCYSVAPTGGDIYDISSIIGAQTVQVTCKSDIAALNVINTVSLSFSYIIP